MFVAVGEGVTRVFFKADTASNPVAQLVCRNFSELIASTLREEINFFTLAVFETGVVIAILQMLLDAERAEACLYFVTKKRKQTNASGSNE
jgi:hypothetical protein